MVIACIISFIIGAILMMSVTKLMSYQKNKKLRNKVRFFVMIGLDNKPGLYIKDIDGRYYPIVNADDMSLFGLNASEFVDMSFEEVREVFINFKQ